MRRGRTVQIKTSSATAWTGSMATLRFVSRPANCSTLLLAKRLAEKFTSYFLDHRINTDNGLLLTDGDDDDGADVGVTCTARSAWRTTDAWCAFASTTQRVTRAKNVCRCTSRDRGSLEATCLIHREPLTSVKVRHASVARCFVSWSLKYSLLVVVVAAAAAAAAAVDLYSASRSACNVLNAPLRCKKDELSAPIWSRRYSEQGPGVSLEASSIPSDRRRK